MLIKYTFATAIKAIVKTEYMKYLIVSIFSVFSITLFAQNAQVTIDQPKAIETLLEYKKDLKTVDIFKIQVYQSNDPFKAEKVKSDFLNAYAEWPVSMEFNTPNYKIWVGNFRDRLEADRALLRIKKKYMNAFIFQSKKD